MKAEFIKKQVYGNELLYPVNEAAKTICSIIKAKTLARHFISQFNQLGIEIEINGGVYELHKAA